MARIKFAKLRQGLEASTLVRRGDLGDVPASTFRRLRRSQLIARRSFIQLGNSLGRMYGVVQIPLWLCSVVLFCWFAIENDLAEQAILDRVPRGLSLLLPAVLERLFLVWFLALMVVSLVMAAFMAVEKILPAKSEDAGLAVMFFIAPLTILLLCAEAALVFWNVGPLQLVVAALVAAWAPLLLALAAVIMLSRALRHEVLKTECDAMFVDALLMAIRELDDVEDRWRPEARFGVNQRLRFAGMCVRRFYASVGLKDAGALESVERLQASLREMQTWTLLPMSDTPEFLRHVITQILVRVGDGDWHGASCVVDGAGAAAPRRSWWRLAFQIAIGVLPLAALIVVSVLLPGSLPAGVWGYLFLVAAAWAGVSVLLILDPESSGDRLRLTGQMVGLLSRRK